MFATSLETDSTLIGPRQLARRHHGPLVYGALPELLLELKGRLGLDTSRRIAHTGVAGGVVLSTAIGSEDWDGFLVGGGVE